MLSLAPFLSLWIIRLTLINFISKIYGMFEESAQKFTDKRGELSEKKLHVEQRASILRNRKLKSCSCRWILLTRANVCQAKNIETRAAESGGSDSFFS